jgi:hypothetical protein
VSTRILKPLDMKDSSLGIPAIDIPRLTTSFDVDGAKLTGTVSDPQGKTAISEGRIDGDEIAFVVMHNFGGNQVKLLYRGKVDLNEIKFTREVQGAKEQRQDFIAKREFQRNNGFLSKW